MPAKKAKKSKPKKKTKPVRKAKKPAAKRKPVKARAARKSTRARKPAVPPQPPPLPWRVPLEGETKIGVVDDYYAHIGVVVLKLEGPLAVGDKIHVRGHTTDLTESVDSMQIAHQGVPRAEAGAAIGIKVNERCRKGDYVYRAAA